MAKSLPLKCPPTQFEDFSPAFSLISGNLISDLKVIDNVLYIIGVFEEVVGTEAGGYLTWDNQQWAVAPDRMKASLRSMQLYNNQLHMVRVIGARGGSEIAAWNR